MKIHTNFSTLTLIKGDIIKQDTEAIVNAANSSLMGGGGVDGAIHRAGGSEILKKCKEIRRDEGECRTGEAVITTGGNLKAKYVIHTVGPVWSGGNKGEQDLLRHCYENSLKLAIKNNISSIAFPSISTGAYRFPVDKASWIALENVIKILESTTKSLKVKFVLFSKNDYRIYAETLTELKNRN